MAIACPRKNQDTDCESHDPPPAIRHFVNEAKRQRKLIEEVQRTPHARLAACDCNCARERRVQRGFIHDRRIAKHERWELWSDLLKGSSEKFVGGAQPSRRVERVLTNGDDNKPGLCTSSAPR